MYRACIGRASDVYRACIGRASPAMRGQPGASRRPRHDPGMPVRPHGHGQRVSRVYRCQAATNDPPPATFRLSSASRQARSGRCRSCAARAMPLIPHGFQSLIMDAEASCFLTARAALSSHPTHRDAGRAPSPHVASVGGSRGQTGTGCCWAGRVSHRHAFEHAVTVKRCTTGMRRIRLPS